MPATLEEVRQRANEEFALALKGTSQDDALHTYLLTQQGDASSSDRVSATPRSSKRCCDKCAQPAAESTNPATSSAAEDTWSSGGFCMDCSIVANLPSPPSTPFTAVSLADRLGNLDAQASVQSPLPLAITTPSPQKVRSSTSTTSPQTAACATVEGDTSPQSTSTSTAARTGAEVVCHNFRELLWYWHEYYLRRGRDRLSIEFSAHIPFRYWRSIVGKFSTIYSVHVPLLHEYFEMLNNRWSYSPFY